MTPLEYNMLLSEIGETLSAYRVYSTIEGLLTRDEQASKNFLEKKLDMLRGIKFRELKRQAELKEKEQGGLIF